MRAEEGKPQTAPVSLGNATRELWTLAKQQRTALAASLALGTGATVAALAQPLMVSSVLDAVEDEGALLAPTMLLVLLFLTDAVLSGAQNYLLARTGEGIVLNMRRGLVEHLLRLPAKEHDRRRLGDLISRVSADTTLLRSAISSSIVGAVGGAMVSVGAVLLMGFIDWVLLLVALLCVLASTLFVLAISSGVREASEEAQRRVGAMSAALDRALGAIRTVKLSVAEERETEAVCKEARAAYSAGMRVARLQASVEPAVGIATQAAFVLVLGVGGARLASGAISLGELVAFLLYLLYLVAPLAMVFVSINNLQQGLAALVRVKEVLDVPAEQVRLDFVEANRSAPKPEQGENPAVTFDSVVFGYRPDLPILQGISFSVPRLTHTALVGPSGTGKSTIFALVERLYEPDFGSVRLDGVDVRELPLNQLRRYVGYVEQDSPVMAGTVRSNLLYANPAATNEELCEVIELANLHSLVEQLPLGLDTEVGDSGTLLSGGERQRIAIARALLARPKVLLLDEVTSALDAKNELALREALSRVSQRCTVLTIAHRLSTILEARQIVVVNEGRVCSVGTHEELLFSDPVYRELTTSQLLDASKKPLTAQWGGR